MHNYVWNRPIWKAGINFLHITSMSWYIHVHVHVRKWRFVVDDVESRCYIAARVGVGAYLEMQGRASAVPNRYLSSYTRLACTAGQTYCVINSLRMSLMTQSLAPKLCAFAFAAAKSSSWPTSAWTQVVAALGTYAIGDRCCHASCDVIEHVSLTMKQTTS